MAKSMKLFELASSNPLIKRSINRLLKPLVMDPPPEQQLETKKRHEDDPEYASNAQVVTDLLRDKKELYQFENKGRKVQLTGKWARETLQAITHQLKAQHPNETFQTQDTKNLHPLQVDKLIDAIKFEAKSIGINIDSNHFQALIPHLCQTSLKGSTKMAAQFMLENKIKEYIFSHVSLIQKNSNLKQYFNEVFDNNSGNQITELPIKITIKENWQGKIAAKVEQSYELNQITLDTIKDHIDLKLEDLKEKFKDDPNQLIATSLLEKDFNRAFETLQTLAKKNSNGFVHFKTKFEIKHKFDRQSNTGISMIKPLSAEAKPLGQLGEVLVPDFRNLGEKVLLSLLAFFQKVKMFFSRNTVSYSSQESSFSEDSSTDDEIPAGESKQERLRSATF